ncbi:ABC transporter ATP-binding protein [Candidatus Bathyarchaeota archaeon]|nr:ABC transporter ATP-binding protein [Candidatus Bathyarchaeota archaeon]MBS7627958.1 ABC transporter ATP-binding protein [Candidatus Bathyarchaeota archaeon]
MALKVAIEASDVTKYYGTIPAVEKVSFKVEETEFFGLLGPNGAGKTTLIRILTGLTAPSFGQALIFGHNPLKEPVKAKEKFGLVPEVSNLYSEMTAWENLIFTAKLYGIPKEKRERRAIELLELFGLKERQKSPVKELSKGMRRRLTIAAALIHNPSILFLDEPTSGLDVQSSKLIRDTLRRLNKEGGVTVFLTTHYIEEADELCHRLAILNHGRVVSIDTPENLKASIQGDGIIEVSFNASAQIHGDLKNLCSKIIKLEENKFQLYVRPEDIPSIFPLITRFAESRGLKVLGVNFIKPSLEEVFIKYTGVDSLMAERLEQIRPKRERG